MARPGPIHREAGFSLVETLVVVAVVAMMTAVAVLSVTGRQSAIEREAERLLARFGEARETALVTGGIVGFTPEADGSGYLFLTYRDGSWRDMPDHPALAPRRLPDGIRLYSEAGRTRRSPDAALAPAFWFDPTGIEGPFAFLLQDSDRDLRLVRDGQGVLRIEEEGR